MKDLIFILFFSSKFCLIQTDEDILNSLASPRIKAQSTKEMSPLSGLKFDLLRREDDALLDRQNAEFIDDAEISFAKADEDFFPIPGMIFELTKMTDSDSQPSLDVPNLDDNDGKKLPPLNFVERKPEDMFQKTRQTRFSQSRSERSPPLRKESKPDDMFQKTRQARFSQARFETSAHRAGENLKQVYLATCLFTVLPELNKNSFRQKRSAANSRDKSNERDKF